MQHLQINNLSYKYLHNDIFINLNLEFTNGFTSIVGQMVQVRLLC